MGICFFVTATGTSSGKTFLTRGLAASQRRYGVRVAAIKPLETGCEPQPLDAVALSRACGLPELAADPAFYRVAPPVSPYAATLAGAPAPDFSRLIERMRELIARHELTIVEGAGGLLVPLDRHRDMADIVAALACPLILAAPNRLGVLSHTLAAVEAARARKLTVKVLVLTEPDQSPDPSAARNLQILRERLTIPVLSFPNCVDDDEALATAAKASGLLEQLDLRGHAA